jgi:hypothetical protein
VADNYGKGVVQGTTQHERNQIVKTMAEGRQVQITGWYADLHGHQALLCSGDVAPGCPHTDGLALWRLLGPSRAATPLPVALGAAA